MLRTRIRLAQNFLRDSHLVSTLVANSSITSKDVVVEIGPGEGIITDELSKVARKVVAVERDPFFAKELRTRMQHKPHVRIFEADFMQFKVDDPAYKIFSNIPFNRTADILKRILDSREIIEAYLIVQAEAAQKYSGEPIETKISVLSKPWFAFEVIHHFQPEDFEPVPSVDVVLFHLKQRDQPLIERNLEDLYRNFVNYGFHSRKSNMNLGFKKIFTYAQWKRLSKDLGFPLKAKPTDLKFEQWLSLFSYFVQGVNEEKKALITIQPSRSGNVPRGRFNPSSKALEKRRPG